jgi:hypothetical protein
MGARFLCVACGRAARRNLTAVKKFENLRDFFFKLNLGQDFPRSRLSNINLAENPTFLCKGGQ